jgi:hypothetical protein
MNDTKDSKSNPFDAPLTFQNEFLIGLVGACAIALCAVFFCPWIMILHVPLSGFDLAKSGGEFRLFALVPLGALWALCADATGGRAQIAKLVAGAIPLLLFAYYYSQEEANLLDALQPGGYGLLGISVAIILVPCRARAKSVPEAIDTSSAN